MKTLEKPYGFSRKPAISGQGAFLMGVILDYFADPRGRVRQVACEPIHKVGALRGPLGLCDWALAHQTIIESGSRSQETGSAAFLCPITNFAGRLQVSYMLR